MDFLIHWPPGPVVATVQCQGLLIRIKIIHKQVYSQTLVDNVVNYHQTQATLPHYYMSTLLVNTQELATGEH